MASTSDDRRPTLLVVALIAAFIAVLFVPALYTYFGLTGPGPIVRDIVLPALVLCFAALNGAYRLRLLDRVLGLDRLPATNCCPSDVSAQEVRPLLSCDIVRGVSGPQHPLPSTRRARCPRHRSGQLAG